MSDTPNEPSVPIEELQALVDKLRERANLVEEHGVNTDDKLINRRNRWNIKAWRSMANELQAVIEDYE